MNTFKNALLALRHPITLFSIGLLLLNDHIFKIYFPSPLTGKLSDFAGLFFFPFLILAAIGLIGRWLGISEKRLRRVAPAAAFGLTGVVFALLKISPWANGMAAEFSRWIFGAPAWNVLDPTDLMALMAFVPAWAVWKRVGESRSPQSGKMAYLVVGLASLAALATSQSIPTRVSRIVTYEDKLYMVIAKENGSYLHGIEASINGHDWINVEFDELPPTLQEIIQQPPQMLICEIEKPQNCYRIANPDQLEGSTDNGQTWQVIWQIPWGRREFMERYRKGQLFGYSRTVDAGPFDLALLELNGRVTLVAAMGNEGILIRNPDKTWERRAEGGGSPTPYAHGQMPFIILNETIVTVLVAIFGLNILSVWLGTNHSVSTSLLDDVMPILWALGISIVGLFLWPWLFSGNNSAFIPLLLLIVSPFYIGPMWTWNRIIRSSAQPALVRPIRNLLLCMAISIFPIAWLPFVAWDRGIIPAYFQAFIMAAILGGSGIAWGIWRLRQIYRKAGETASTPTENVVDDPESS